MSFDARTGVGLKKRHAVRTRICKVEEAAKVTLSRIESDQHSAAFSRNRGRNRGITNHADSIGSIYPKIIPIDFVTRRSRQGHR